MLPLWSATVRNNRLTFTYIRNPSQYKLHPYYFNQKTIALQQKNAPFQQSEGCIVSKLESLAKLKSAMQLFWEMAV